METCKRLKINLRDYLNDVLPKLPSWPVNNVTRARRRPRCCACSPR